MFSFKIPLFPTLFPTAFCCILLPHPLNLINDRNILPYHFSLSLIFDTCCPLHTSSVFCLISSDLQHSFSSYY